MNTLLIKRLIAFFHGDIKEDSKKIIIKIVKKNNKFFNEDYNENFETKYLNSIKKITGDLLSYEFKKFDEEFSFTITYSFQDLDIIDNFDLTKKIKLSCIEYSDKENLEKLILSIFALRSSFDFTGNFVALDWKKNKTNINDLNTFLELIIAYSDISKFNLNFRELQKKSSTKNTQIRLNLAYFAYKTNDSLLDYFTYKIIISNKNKIESSKINKNENYMKKINDYMSIINAPPLSDSEINEYRILYNIKATTEEIKRNASIKNLAKKILPEKCSGCCDDFKLDNRTFKYRNSGQYYLEIHHVLPFSINKSEFDNIENLTKLCPACHKALTPNRANESLQKKIIKSILKNNLNVQNFIYKQTNIKTMDNLIEYIYLNLK